MGNSALAVLLVEDNMLDQQILLRCLRQSHVRYDVTTVSTLQCGVQSACDQSFDVILTDLHLSDADGTESVTRLSRIDGDYALIVYSASCDPEIYTRVLELGADDYIDKNTVSIVTLERTIEQSLTRARQRRRIAALIRREQSQRQMLADQSLELVRKNQRLQRLCDSATKFVNNVSHEFRTPLCVIRQHAALVADGIVGEINQEQSGLLRVVEDRVDALNTMVDDMLDVNRLEAGLLSAEREVFCPASHAAEVIEKLRPRAAVRDCEIRLRVDDDLPSVYADPAKIGRIISNLVVNAIKFSGGGEVRVHVGRDPEASAERPAVRVSIADDGPGIQPEELETIFQRFKQGRGSSDITTKGFGLGLNIARELTDLNLGEITVESQVGSGSTFAFTMPTGDPGGLVRRHADRLQSDRSDQISSVINVYQIAPTDPSVDSDARQDLSGFLNYLLRCNDLLLHRGDHWTLLLSGSESAMSQFKTRLEREWNLVNRNRPQGPLATIRVYESGRFELPVDHDSLIASIGPEHDDFASVGPGHHDFIAGSVSPVADATRGGTTITRSTDSHALAGESSE